jgi:hypothetical protein
MFRYINGSDIQDRLEGPQARFIEDSLGLEESSGRARDHHANVDELFSLDPGHERE